MDDNLSHLDTNNYEVGDGNDCFEDSKPISPMSEQSPDIAFEALSRAGSKKDEHLLYCRLDQPIVGVLLKPRVTIPKKGNDDQAIDIESLKYSWYRFSKHTVCCSYRCINEKNDEKKEPAPLTMQCIDCLKYGNVENSYFCSTLCMCKNWKLHQKTHHLAPNSVLNKEYTSNGTIDETIMKVSKNLHYDKQVAVWEHISDDPSYTPVSTDIGHMLKFEIMVPRKGSTLTYTYVSAPIVSFPPYHAPRVFYNIPQPRVFNPITLCSYNMLADIYTSTSQYPYCPRWALMWDYRRERLRKEIESIHTDIFCLQEVQKESFDNFWLSEMNQLNYDGKFAQKSRADVQGRIDGCVTFFNRDKFQCVGEYSFSFDEEVERFTSLTSEQKSRMIRGNIAQVLLLDVLDNQKVPFTRICICNTHIFWNPKYMDVKLWQVHRLMKYIDSLWTKHVDPVIFCGDFNSEPRSAVYDYISEGYVTSNTKDVSYDPFHILPPLQDLQHDIKFQSAYKTIQGKEPDFTNYTKQYSGCLDYIWFTPLNLRVLDVSPLPTVSQIREHKDTFIPNTQYPSDHLPLIVKFDFNL
ncbi:hypothetical protein WA158_005100 [Blastocystis sp. Blastoise]